MFLAVMAFLLCAPVFYSTFGQGPQWPRVHGGDEPHYLVLLHSLLLDGDFDLRNNYLSVHQGSLQAGRNFARSSLDHHSTYWVGGERRIWSELFDPRVFTWPKDAHGQPLPTVRPGVDPALAQKLEAPAHPVGIALLLAPLTFPLRHASRALEPWVICLAALATVGALLCAWRLFGAFSPNPKTVRLALVAVFLGSPVWYYARSFFNEPFLLLLLTSAALCAVHPARAWLTGGLVALAMLMKPQSVLLLGPFALPLLWGSGASRGPRLVGRLVALGALPLAAGLFQLWLNARLYGAPHLGPYPFYRGDALTGARGLWLAPRRGLLVYAPWLVLALVGWPLVVRRTPLNAAVCGSAFALLFGLTAVWKYWDGGWCYGPRLLVPALPLLGVGVVGFLDAPKLQGFFPRWLFTTCVLGAALLNGFAALRYGQAIDLAPLQLLLAPLGPL